MQSAFSRKQNIAEMKLRRLTDNNVRLQGELNRQRIKVSEASTSYVVNSLPIPCQSSRPSWSLSYLPLWLPVLPASLPPPCVACRLFILPSPFITPPPGTPGVKPTDRRACADLPAFVLCTALCREIVA